MKTILFILLFSVLFLVACSNKEADCLKEKATVYCRTIGKELYHVDEPTKSFICSSFDREQGNIYKEYKFSNDEVAVCSG